MSLAIAIPTSGRIEYLKLCLESVVAQSFPVENILVCQDSEQLTEEVFLLVAENLPQAILQTQPKRQYADAAIISARNRAFEYFDDVEVVLTMDDDLVISPHFVGVLMALHKWAARFGDHIVQSSIDFIGEPIFKQRLSSAVCCGLSTGTHTLMSRSNWLKVRPILDQYASAWAGNPPSQFDVTGIREWFKSLVEGSKPMAGDSRAQFLTGAYGVASDAALQVACSVAQIPTAHLCVNRAITIGEIGSNFTPENFTQLKRVNLDDVDTSRTGDFFWSPYETEFYYRTLFG